MLVQTLKKIANQTSFQLIGKVISSIVTLFSLALITNNYGAEGTGLYTLILTYLSFFYLAADMGFNAYALPLLKEGNVLFSKILGFRIFLGIILTFIAVIGAVFVPDRTGGFFTGVLFGAISILGSATFVTSNLLFQKYLRYDLSVLTASITTILSGLLIWIMVANKFSISTLLVNTSICWLICALISLVFARRFAAIEASVDFTFIKNSFAKIWPISATLLLNVFYFRIDSFLINYFHSLSAVGIYNFAYQFFQTALVLPTFIMNALYPILLENEKKSAVQNKILIYKAFVIMICIGVAGTIVTWVVSPVLISQIAFKGGFQDSIYTLQVLGLSFPAFFGSAVLMWSLVTLNLNQKMFLVYLIGLVFNIIFNLIFIPAYSVIAAAWVTVGSEYMILIMQLFIVLRYYNRRNP